MTIHYDSSQNNILGPASSIFQYWALWTSNILQCPDSHKETSPQQCLFFISVIHRRRSSQAPSPVIAMDLKLVYLWNMSPQLFTPCKRAPIMKRTPSDTKTTPNIPQIRSPSYLRFGQKYDKYKREKKIRLLVPLTAYLTKHHTLRFNKKPHKIGKLYASFK